VPLVSFLLAVHNGARYLGAAVESALSQTVEDLELIVIDDASTDETPVLLGAVGDSRLVVLRNDRQAGLAASLNRGLDAATGRYVARLDDDDVAVPERLERQLARMNQKPNIAIVGSAVVDLDSEGTRGRTHVLPLHSTALRWHALFSSPFFHPTVLVDRDTLERHGLRYDPSFLESEDYDLWTRLFAFAAGANLSEPLVGKRVHAAQASLRRSDLQQSFQRRVALREIALLAPGLGEEQAELAWGLGSGRVAPTKEAGHALLELLGAFERHHGRDRRVREAVGRVLLRGRLFGDAAWLAGHRRRPRPAGGDVIHVVVVSPEPTPYRAPLFDRVARAEGIDLTVIYAAHSVAHRAWSVEPAHRHVFLRGFSVPGAERLLRHQYPVTPGTAGALRQAQPDVVVVSGWSTFASQSAIAWCRAHRVPYVLLVESHDLGPRAAWRQALKGAIVPRLLRGAANVLVVGSAARDSVAARGATSVRRFANTIDVAAWTARAQSLERNRADDDVLVLSVARLVADKGIDDLIRALADSGDPRLRLVVAGDGPEREALVQLAAELGVRLTILGHVAEAELAQLYVDADVFALLSRHEPWGVAVNEAAASGLPLVLSDRVGAASDLLAPGRNGFLVPAGDVQEAAAGLKLLAGNPALRHELGARSRELVRDWNYETSVVNFVAAVREATSR
jgi:glycosyltransferase involved in cell wall biosynthesis/GT2 family glycosyltransferase